MRRILCIIICLSVVPIASALSITNGNFENQTGLGSNYDIKYRYDYGGPTLATTAGPFWNPANSFSMNRTKIACNGQGSNTSEDGGNHAYIYQSIGIYDGNPSVAEIALDWGLIPTYTPGEMGITVMILESDGTFEPNEWDGAAHDIYGFRKTEANPNAPITEIGRGSVIRYAAEGVVMHERFQIDLTSATVGKELFLRINAFRRNVTPWVSFDNITLSPAYVVNKSPQNGAVYVATELASPENDLVFNVADPAIVAVDILFGTDPNLITATKIVAGMPVTPGLNTVDLVGELAQDLNWTTTYYWKVLAYESNGSGGLSLKYTGLITSFTTIQYGPLLGGITPAIQAVWPGEDAVFTVPFTLKADTLQWYKAGNPDVALADGADYAGTSTNKLTVLNCRTEDEGIYYCIGTETATGATIESTNRGELAIKELKSYLPFDSTGSDAQGMYSPDIISGKHLYLRGGASVKSGADPNSIAGGHLKLLNPRGVTHTQYGEFLNNSIAHHRDITISCWVKPTILDLDYERYARIFDFGQDANNYFYLTLLQATNAARCVMNVAGDDNELNGTGDIGYGAKWIYVVLTIEDSDGKLYINGQYSGGGGMYSPSELPKTLNYIGKAIAAPETGSYPNFDGLIDEVKIYNYARTAEQIAQEYMDVRTDVSFICDREDYDLGDWDFNGDCLVDIKDLLVIAEKWLMNYFMNLES